MSDEQYLTQNQLLLAKIEATRGTDPTPTPAADALKCSGLTINPQFDLDAGDSEHTSSIDGGDPTVLGGHMQATFGVRMKGAGTAGNAPEWGVLLRGCRMAETLTASLTGTAQAGAASTITLAASGPSTTDDAYNGMVITIDGGTGVGQTNIITDYVGSTKVATVGVPWTVEPDNTSTYEIFANALYAPASNDLETITLWGYQHANLTATNSRLRKINGAAGNFTLELGPGQIPQMNFTFDGILPAAPTNVALPTGVAYDSTDTLPFVAADAYLGTTTVKFNRLSLDLAAAVALPDDPAATYGKDHATQTKSLIAGNITPYQKLFSIRDFVTDFLAGTERMLWLRWGSTAGNRLSILVPAAKYTGQSEQDIDGFAGESVPFRCTGADTGLYIAVY